MIKVAVSGGFDPVHVGHLRMFQEAKKLGDHLTVILNCDDWLVRKKGKFFMCAEERAEIIKGFACVDDVYIHQSDKDDVSDALRIVSPHVFANGGDRKVDNTPEGNVCAELGIRMYFGVGGGKVQSSSELTKKYGEK